MAMITPEDILEAMDMEARKVCENTFLQERPNATDPKLTEFIVVSLPYSTSNRTLGENDDWWLDVTVVFEIFVADRKTNKSPKEFNQPAMKELRQSLFDLFPIVRENSFKIDFPRTVIPASSDGNGYHYTRIQAKFTTMV
jgi:hypothetical protein